MCGLWAGLECGTLAGAITLAWFALHSLTRGEFWWSKFNVAAGWFYDLAVYRAGLSRVTLCGAAVIMLFYGLTGACYGLAWGVPLRARAFLTTALYVVAIHLFAAHFLWPSFGPFARLWFPWQATLPAHVALFAALARYPVLYGRLVNDFGDPDWLPRQHPSPPADGFRTQPSATGFEAPGEASSSADSAKE